jgi:hypothetical protein
MPYGWQDVGQAYSNSLQQIMVTCSVLASEQLIYLHVLLIKDTNVYSNQLIWVC